jgi:hypothetical protein
MTYITTYPPSGAHTFNAVWIALHMSQGCIHVLRKWPQDIPRSLLTLGTRSWLIAWRMSAPHVGTALSKPHFEATGLEFTSPSGRILTFLPCRRCVITKSKLQKVNPGYLTTCQDCYSPYAVIEAYPHRRFSKIWPSVSYYTRTALIPAVTSHH